VALFGLIRTAGEEVTATIREWLGVDYVVGGLATAAGTVSAAYLGELVPSALNLTGRWYPVAKSLVKVGLSGLYYFLGKAARAPWVGLTASIGAFASLVQDLVKWALKGSPEELGAIAGMQLAGTWYKAASVEVAPLSPAEAAEAAPAPAPAPAETGAREVPVQNRAEGAPVL